MTAFEGESSKETMKLNETSRVLLPSTARGKGVGDLHRGTAM